jgi:hypothetical protein
MRHDKHFLLLFPFTGADTNRIPPYDQLSKVNKQRFLAAARSR